MSAFLPVFFLICLLRLCNLCIRENAWQSTALMRIVVSSFHNLEKIDSGLKVQGVL